MTWFRACVDFDAAGNAIAHSYEARDDDGELVALEHSGCGPFDDAFEVFGDCLANLRRRFGLQTTLF